MCLQAKLYRLAAQGAWQVRVTWRYLLRPCCKAAMAHEDKCGEDCRHDAALLRDPSPSPAGAGASAWREGRCVRAMSSLSRRPTFWCAARLLRRLLPCAPSPASLVCADKDARRGCLSWLP